MASILHNKIATVVTTALQMLFIISVLLSTLSCESDLKYDLKMETPESKVVVNCTFTADSSWHMSVLKSSNIFTSDRWDPVSNATVTITDASGTTSVLNGTGNGQYTLSQKPQFSKTYSLSVVVPGYAPVEAYDFQPAKISIESISFIDSVMMEDSVYLSQARIEIEDDESMEDFYEIIVYQKGDHDQVIPLELRSDDLAMENSGSSSVLGGGSEYKKYLLANDKIFNGRKYGFNVKFIKKQATADVFIEIRSLSKNLHEYLLTYSQHIDNRDNPFTQPVSVYTNIKNGLGIFGGYSSHTRKI